jgi:hypothetical protein
MEFLKKIITISLLVILFVCGFNNEVFAEDEIKINVNVGFDGTYKMGYYAPINLEITNNLKDIQGEVQVGICDENGNTTMYSKEVNLPQNSTKNVTINMPTLNYTSKMYIKLNEGKKVYYEELKSISYGIDAQYTLIGVLSDEPDNINYLSDFKTLTFQNSNFSQSKTIYLNETIFPESINAFDSFNALIINNYDTSKLNEKQYNVLKAWVNNGGTLIIGTGLSYEKSLNIFSDDFLAGDIGKVEKFNTKAIADYTGGSNENMDINLLNLNVKDSISILKDNETSIIQKLEKGKGTIAVLSFDLGLKPISDWDFRYEFIKKLSTDVSPNNLVANPDEKMNMFNGIQYNLTNIPELPMPTAAKTLIIFMIYFLLVSPISYLVLKKLDKRELMWGVVPSLSLFFIVVMFVSGISTRVTTSVVNSINYINVGKNGNNDISSFASILTPTKQDVIIEEIDERKLIPMMNNDYYMYSSYQSSSGTSLKVEDVKITSKVLEGNTNSIEFFSKAVFSNNAIEIGNGMAPKGNILSSVNFSDKVYSGTVTNEFDFDVYDCYILLNNKYISIGNIKAGETKEVNDKGHSYGGYIYDLTDKIYNINGYNNISPFTSGDKLQEIKKSRQKSEFLNTYFQMQGSIKNAKIIAWADTKFNDDFLINGKEVKSFEKSLIIADADVTFIKDGKAEYPLGFTIPEIIPVGYVNGGYDQYSGYIYGKGDYQLNFSLNDYQINMEEIGVKFSKTASNNVELYMYNNQTNQWELSDSNSYEVLETDINKYLDSQNKFKLKISILTDGMETEIPKISVKGSVK